ncbi:MAG: hypothetical protein QOH24_678 [Verrucomicrobiota bacterium]
MRRQARCVKLSGRRIIDLLQLSLYKVRARHSYGMPGPELNLRLSSGNVRESRQDDRIASPDGLEPTHSGGVRPSSRDHARKMGDPPLPQTPHPLPA